MQTSTETKSGTIFLILYDTKEQMDNYIHDNPITDFTILDIENYNIKSNGSFEMRNDFITQRIRQIRCYVANGRNGVIFVKKPYPEFIKFYVDKILDIQDGKWIKCR